MPIQIINPTTVSPSGTNTQVQFNDNNTFNGDNGLTYNKTTDVLSVVGSVITPKIKSGSTGNAPLILESSGFGAIQFETTDNTAVGGNSRGLYALDLQKGFRDSATQVASGSNAIAIGEKNTASSYRSIAIGANNTVTAGNACLGIGLDNISSGDGSITIGRANNNSSGITIGGFNTTNNSGIALGNNCNSIARSIALGVNTTTRNINSLIAYSNNIIPGISKAQLDIILLSRETTNNTQVTLISSNAIIDATNQFTLQNNSAIAFSGLLVANVTNASDTSAWEFKGCIKRGATANTTVLINTVTPVLIAQDTGASTWLVSITADTTLGCLSIKVTGQTGRTIRWNAVIYASEVAF